VRDSKRVNNILDKLDLFNIPYSSNLRQYIPNMGVELEEFPEKITDKSDPDFTRPITYLSYISDRWNSPSRILFILRVLEKYSLEELREMKKFLDNPDVEIRKRGITYSTEQPQTNQPTVWVELSDLSKEQLCKLTYIHKVKRFGKVWKGKDHHNREYDLIYLDGNMQIHKSSKKYHFSNKWVWLMDSTSRYKKEIF
jgi:hypothetical protein